MKIITKQFLKKHKACQDGIDYLFSLKDKSLFKPVNFINHCIKLDDKEKHQWANWLIVRCMNKKQKVQYAVFAAEQVLPLYENKYPDDNRPRKAIETVKKYIKNPIQKNKAAAADAAAAYSTSAAAADAASYAAAAAAAATDQTLCDNHIYHFHKSHQAAAADAASYAAYAAADAAYAADASYAAADTAYAAADAAYNILLIKILKFGLTLIK